MSEKKHHILGPSQLPRILNCIGSLYGPPIYEPPSKHAEEGNVCHSLLEFCLSFGDSPRNHLGSVDYHPDFPITIEMVEAVELFIETAEDLCREFGIDPSNIKSEQKLIHDSIPNELFGGTADCLIPGEDVLVVMDLKYGRRQVLADSWQLTAYSLLALGLFGRTFSRVVQIIVQPRGNPQVSRYEPGADELNDVWNRICEAAQFILENPDMTEPKPDKLVAGAHCKYCKRREGCPAREGMVSEFTEIAVFKHPDTQNYLSSGTAEVPTEVLVEWMGKFDAIKEFMADVQKTLLTRASQGHPVPDHKLALKYGNREWVEPDDDKMQRKLSRGGLGLSAKELVVKSLASPAQVEKVLKARDNWKELKPTFEKFYQSKVTGVKLVHKTAKGIEVRPETAVEFLKAMEENPDE